MAFSCLAYRMLIDPLLRPLRVKLAALVPIGSSVIEFGSGTGAQACALADRCGRYLGVDLDPDMTDCARERCRVAGHGHLAFRNADGADLADIADGAFDCAAITLALHELPQAARLAILGEMRRVARVALIADYAAPLPRGFAGVLSRSIERMAGGAHYAGFRHYQAAGGLRPLLSAAGLEMETELTALQGSVHLIRCRQRAARPADPSLTQ
jgi:SAM-dependent methyltransferase